MRFSLNYTLPSKTIISGLLYEQIHEIKRKKLLDASIDTSYIHHVFPHY